MQSAPDSLHDPTEPASRLSLLELNSPPSGIHAEPLFRTDAERRPMALMLARLALTLVSFGIVLLLDRAGFGVPLTAIARRGLYWTLAFGFLATAVSGLYVGRVRSPIRSAVLQLAADLSVVTLLVHFSGGHESVFSFLYVAVTAYGAMLFDRRSALAAACASAAAYGGVLLVEQLGFGVDFGGVRDAVHWAVAAATWGVHVGALFLVGALGSVVTGELRRTGAALDRSSDANRRLRDLNAHIVRSLNSGLLTTERDGRIGSFNPEAERITGRAAAQVFGRHVDEVIPGAWPLVTGSGGEGLEPVRRTRLAYEPSEGESMFLGLAGSALRDAAGEPVGHLLIFQDVTHVVEMEDELTQRARLAAVGEMAAKIAHEIRNPLAAISGSVQILSEDRSPVSGGDPQRLMDIVVREADRLSGLITDFLGYARPRAPVREPVVLHRLASEVLELLRGVAASGVAFELVGDPDVSALGDTGQLRQVMWNLCLNGVEAMPEGGTLRVRVVADAAASQGLAGAGRKGGWETADCGSNGARRYVEIVVEDDGEGIESEWLDRLFEPFFTTKAEGTGLGLATVHRIVEAHGGDLQVDTKPGGGTSFRVRLEKNEGES